jgi:hypothetical protein
LLLGAFSYLLVPDSGTKVETSTARSSPAALIPAQKTDIQQRHTYDGQCKAAGLSHMHGLRHRYAQARYEALTGWKAPAAGGPSARTLTPAERALDEAARQTIRGPRRAFGHIGYGIFRRCGTRRKSVTKQRIGVTSRMTI